MTTVAIIGVAAVVLWGGTGSGASEPGGAASAAPPVPPSTVAQEFVSAFMTGDTAKAAATTDGAAAAANTLTKIKKDMGTASFHARLGQVPTIAEGANSTTLSADVTWTLPDSTAVRYQTSIELRRADGKWLVHWAPSVLHPKLAAEQSLAYLPTSGDGALLDRAGQPIPATTGDYASTVLPGVRKAVGSLGGTPGWQVAVVDAVGAPVTVLEEKKAVATKSVTVTLDPKVQNAAQAAVDQVGQQAVVVAIQPSSGEILAVAQNAAANSGGPIALTNYFEPGSTFKIVTAAAALAGGDVTADTPVECPGSTTIGPRTIHNENDFDLGTVPLHRAFAASCNTSFGKISADLPPDALLSAARRFGIGANYTIPGLTTNTGKAFSTASVAQRVEAGIGQGDVQVTPFGMALVAATTATGRTPLPRLIRELDTQVDAQPPALSGGIFQALKPMMSEVVTGGTARELAGFGGVRGKTGTAQFGDGTHSHGWFVGYQDDLAFAVLVVDGGSSKAAVGVTASFLSGI